MSRRGYLKPQISLNLTDFAQNTSLHGLKYIGERKRHWIEWIFWAIVFLISFLLCTVLITEMYRKWQRNPMIISFDKRATPVSELLFPAVTICPETKAHVKHINVTKAFRKIHRNEMNFSLEEAMNLEAVAQVCKRNVFSSLASRYHRIESTLQAKNIIGRLKRIFPPDYGILEDCSWQQFRMSCDHLFKETVTCEGICYTFNLIDFDELFVTEK